MNSAPIGRGPQVHDDPSTIDALAELLGLDHVRVEVGHDPKTGNPIYQAGYHVETTIAPDDTGTVNLKVVNDKHQVVIVPSHRLPAGLVPAPGVRTGPAAPQPQGVSKPPVPAKDGK